MKSGHLQKNTEILKNLLCNFFNEDNTNLKFIPYIIYDISKAGTMRNIILQHNIFLKNMAIVPIINIQDKDVNKNKTNIDNCLYFLGREPTR